MSGADEITKDDQPECSESQLIDAKVDWVMAKLRRDAHAIHAGGKGFSANLVKRGIDGVLLEFGASGIIDLYRKTVSIALKDVVGDLTQELETNLSYFLTGDHGSINTSEPYQERSVRHAQRIGKLKNAYDLLGHDLFVVAMQACHSQHGQTILSFDSIVETLKEKGEKGLKEQILY